MLGRYQPVQGTSHQLSPELPAVALQNVDSWWHPAWMRYTWHRTGQLSPFNTFHLLAMPPPLRRPGTMSSGLIALKICQKDPGVVKLDMR